jgi:hypothetical protein
MLDGRSADVTFECDKQSGECRFEGAPSFCILDVVAWFAKKESFYCKFSECAFEYGASIAFWSW